MHCDDFFFKICIFNNIFFQFMQKKNRGRQIASRGFFKVFR